MEKARAIVDQLTFPPVNRATLPLELAVGKVCARDVVADRDVPPADLSAMDGYALRAEDAGRGLRVRGKVFPSGGDVSRLDRGEAAYVATGSALPEGADAVARVEAAKLEGGELRVLEEVFRWKDVRRAGEDVRRGELVLGAGTRVRTTHLGLLTVLGVEELEVYLPRIGVLSVGDELSPFYSPEAGKSRDALGRALVATLSGIGEVRYLGVVGDSVGEIGEAVSRSVRSLDLLITVGGSSVGERDLVKAAVSSVGEVLFEGVTVNVIKRGGLGEVGGRPVLMLPGQAVAAFATLAEHGYRLLSRMLGARLQRTETVELGTDVTVNHKMDTLYVFAVDDGVATPLRWGVGLYSVLAQADAYAVLRRGETYRRGERIVVRRLV
ncbi:molybdopterin molybdenumtransferase MoeA [Sulfodiicoccus acidiphilus]|uniref:Molybdopterin molybdenumtransferase MoeA n=1 Tax=Sulfodiicoccus acidiphilus TaxID=1670455 RepID=A0A348B0M3_9CREN|nr:molybdopterin molybdotransferase MoeA [Sulfodiicoccus acidiphilus]BBD71725.1 molybdopterin molybdenumtransferase MoeA [Sulfodiicoccus acidiphilus]GGT86315.1 molybdopterin molybdenumtransferase MoeA [Sulfodiicoccus acidiphilus]